MHTVIMGGTSGIGLATAERLVKDGQEVTVTGRDAGRLAAVPDPIRAVALDGTDRAAVTAFFADLGEVDHLVLAQSPGAVGVGPFRETEPAAIDTAFGKLFAYLHAIQVARVTGSITMISGAAARSAAPGTVTLAAVNGGIERAVSPLAVELAPVRVNVVAPGLVDTAWWGFVPDSDRPAAFATYTGSLPIARAATADEVADAVAFLIGAAYVTGSVLSVDGGATVA